MNSFIETTQRWLEETVIGLNLCPFAARPVRLNRVRITCTESEDAKEILSIIRNELKLLETSTSDQLETTLVVTPNAFPDFLDYNDFLSRAELVIKKAGLEGVFQLASFHPNYQFYGTAPEDLGNLTNRSPYPIFHLLREESLEHALAEYSEPESIYETNIKTVSDLKPEILRKKFWYLFT